LRPSSTRSTRWSGKRGSADDYRSGASRSISASVIAIRASLAMWRTWSVETGMEFLVWTHRQAMLGRIAAPCLSGKHWYVTAFTQGDILRAEGNRHEISESCACRWYCVQFRRACCRGCHEAKGRSVLPALREAGNPRENPQWPDGSHQ